MVLRNKDTSKITRLIDQGIGWIYSSCMNQVQMEPWRIIIKNLQEYAPAAILSMICVEDEYQEVSVIFTVLSGDFLASINKQLPGWPPSCKGAKRETNG